MRGKIIKIETFFINNNSYLDYMWIRIFINRTFRPIITPFFDFKKVFLEDSDKLEKLINCEIEWITLNSKNSEFEILSTTKTGFIYASIKTIIYPDNYSSLPYFEFHKIVNITLPRFGDKELRITIDNNRTVMKTFEDAYELISYEPANYILYNANTKTPNLGIVIFRHCREFYEETFFKYYKNREHYVYLYNGVKHLLPNEGRYSNFHKNAL